VAGIDSRVGFVFQGDALFPWRTVIDNVILGPVYRGMAKSQAYDLATEWIGTVGLAGFARHYPHQLSGGMRKRVALAQTFINRPDILLLDEPFSALDVQTRILMQDELLHLWSTTLASVVFVTNALADEVYVLTAGPATVKSVYQIDLPRPRNAAEIRYEQQFIEISRRIWHDLRDEVKIGNARSRIPQDSPHV
jgi:NitT/TauT family transport system ATP-binding protein